MRRKWKCNWRKSLACFTGPGVLDPKELSDIIGEAERIENHVRPRIAEDVARSTDPFSSLGNGNLAADNIEAVCSEDISASTQKSVAPVYKEATKSSTPSDSSSNEEFYDPRTSFDASSCQSIHNESLASDWCTLPDSMILLIATRLFLFEDFIAFRSVCSSWHKATTLNDFSTSSSSCPKPPLLMSRLALKRREFTSLSKGRKTCKIWMPEATSEGMENECIGSKGWLIMVERCSTGNMSLFHPLTRVQIPLPKSPRNVIIPIQPKEFICAVLSASPSDTSDYVVMVVFRVKSCISRRRYTEGDFTWFWKPGNKTWTIVKMPHYKVEDLNYYNDKFYALTLGGSEGGYQYQVWMCDVYGPNKSNMAIKISELPWSTLRPKAQLVECQGILLIISPCSQGLDKSCLYDLKMVEIDVITGSYYPITSLGSSSVFLGRNQGFSIVSNEFPGIIHPNLIYFANGFIAGNSCCNNEGDGPGKTSISKYGLGIWINY